MEIIDRCDNIIVIRLEPDEDKSSLVLTAKMIRDIEQDYFGELCGIFNGHLIIRIGT